MIVGWHFALQKQNLTTDQHGFQIKDDPMNLF